MCSALQKLGLNRKKKQSGVAFAGTERVMKLRLQYWEKVKDIEPKNLVFLDETGVLLGLTRTHASNEAREPMRSNLFIEARESQ
jgi:hypothetical protein